MKSIKLGLIGLGQFGVNYLRLLRDMKGVTLSAVANSADAVFEIHKNLLQGIKTTTNTEDIFSDPDIGAVFIVTPPSTHYKLIEAGLRAGKHVLVEKPMVVSVSEAEKLKALVERSGKVFMVGYQYLFNDNVRYVKQEIGKGTFGKITAVKSEQAIIPSRPDVDVFWDDAPHPLSIFQWIYNPKKLISAAGKLERDNASVKIQFENAPTLEIIASCFGKKKTRKFTIIGEKATAILDETLDKNKLAILKNGKTSYPEIILKEPLRSEIEHFIHCIKTGETPLTNIDFGLKITEWLETISERLGKK